MKLDREGGRLPDVSGADRWGVRTSTRGHRRRPGESSLLSQGRGGRNVCNSKSLKLEIGKGSRPAREVHQTSCSSVRFDVGGVEGLNVSEEGREVGESMPKKAIGASPYSLDRASTDPSDSEPLCSIARTRSVRCQRTYRTTHSRTALLPWSTHSTNPDRAFPD